MNAAGRLSLYAAGVVVAFAGAFGIAAMVVPSDFAAAEDGAVEDEVAAAEDEGQKMNDHGEMSVDFPAAADPPPSGLSLSGGGYSISPVTAPTATGESGELSFRILADDGEPLTTYAVAHEQDLHLITVRNDGTQFRHVHPALDTVTGVWSLPWEWEAAGTYRVYADFTPDVDAAERLTLTRNVQVAGDYSPVAPEPTRLSTVDEFAVSIAGDLVAGAASELTISVSRGTEPVTALEPYLGAFGHLVALREGDLAYLHVHADGEDPAPGETSGPEISFVAEAPTAGRYLLYLDFQVEGQVHTAEFVLDAAPSAKEGTR